jgi:hypothetical protein
LDTACNCNAQIFSPCLQLARVGNRGPVVLHLQRGCVQLGSTHWASQLRCDISRTHFLLQEKNCFDVAAQNLDRLRVSCKQLCPHNPLSRDCIVCGFACPCCSCSLSLLRGPYLTLAILQWRGFDSLGFRRPDNDVSDLFATSRTMHL